MKNADKPFAVASIRPSLHTVLKINRTLKLSLCFSKLLFLRARDTLVPFPRIKLAYVLSRGKTRGLFLVQDKKQGMFLSLKLFARLHRPSCPRKREQSDRFVRQILEVRYCKKSYANLRNNYFKLSDRRSILLKIWSMNKNCHSLSLENKTRTNIIQTKYVKTKLLQVNYSVDLVSKT